MRLKMIKNLSLLGLALGLLWPGPASAQEREMVWTYRAAPGGWIGVTVSFEGQVVDGVETGVVTITEVIEGGPAAMAGLLIGDVLTHVDGRPVTPQYVATMPSTLTPGDLLEFVVQRDGEVMEVSIEAAEKENIFVLREPDIQRMAVTLDTIRGTISKNLESLTVTIAGLQAEQGPGPVGVSLIRLPSKNVEFPEGTILHLKDPSDPEGSAWGRFVVDPSFSMSFQGLLVASEETDSLRREVLVARKELTNLRRQEMSRERQIRAAIQGNPEAFLANDVLLQELRARELELVANQEDLNQRLARVQEDQLRRQWAEAQARSREALAASERERVRISTRSSAEASASERRIEEELERLVGRYRSPIIVGQDYILGADVKPLTPALARALARSGEPIEEGVVVYQVPAGTPAAELGFQDLDVIIRAAGEPVRSIGDLRASLELYRGPLRLTVVRVGEDEPVEIIIRR